MLKALPLGLVTVATAGTPVPITTGLIAAAGGGLPPSGGVCRIEAHAAAGNTGLVLIKVNGVILDNLLVPADGVTGHWAMQAAGNEINPTTFSLDAAVGTAGGVAMAVPSSGHLGLLYAVNDTGLITTGGGNAVYTVTGVGAGGLVTSVSITTPGTGNAVSTANATSASTGSGDGNLKLDITGILSGDGAYVTLWVE